MTSVCPSAIGKLSGNANACVVAIQMRLGSSLQKGQSALISMPLYALIRSGVNIAQGIAGAFTSRSGLGMLVRMAPTVAHGAGVRLLIRKKNARPNEH